MFWVTCYKEIDYPIVEPISFYDSLWDLECWNTAQASATSPVICPFVCYDLRDPPLFSRMRSAYPHHIAFVCLSLTLLGLSTSGTRTVFLSAEYFQGLE